MKLKECIIRITNFVFKILTNNENSKANSIMKACCIAYENQTHNYCSYKQRSGSTKDLIINEELNPNLDNCAIVIQGPIIVSDDFTLNTVNWYKRLYPKCKIIVSTWENSNLIAVKKIEEAGAAVVLSQLPTISGLGNINYQIVTTRAGIEAAKKMDAKYILKTRSDQRIYKLYFLEYFITLINHYKITNDERKYPGSRILALHTMAGGDMFIPYFIADFLYFGAIEDIDNLFDINLDQTINMTKDERRNWLKELLNTNPNIGDYYSLTAPEIKIIKNYVHKYINPSYSDSIRDYWKVVKDYFIIISWEDIDLFWPKYNRYNESLMFRSYSPDDSQDVFLQYNWSFQNWLLLYQGFIKYNDKIEEYRMIPCQKKNIKL